jgi:hypothetical protein
MCVYLCSNLWIVEGTLYYVHTVKRALHAVVDMIEIDPFCRCPVCSSLWVYEYVLPQFDGRRPPSEVSSLERGVLIYVMLHSGWDRCTLESGFREAKHPGRGS